MKPDMKKLKRLCLMPFAAALLSAVSCETIYDGLAPCQTEYRVTFKYDRNINGADAFHKEVKSVDLWMFTPEGSLVWHGSEAGAALQDEDYAMTVPVGPGIYDVVVWGGLDGQPAYVLGSSSPASLDDLNLAIRTVSDAAGTYVGEDLTGLYHGFTRVTFEEPEYGGQSDVLVPLMKNTNVLRVMLQYYKIENAVGKVMKPEDFDFIIDDSVSQMGYDNRIIGNSPFAYRWWMKTAVSAGFDYEGTRAGEITQVNGLLSERTVGRLLADRQPVLRVVRNSDGEEIIRLPLVKYLLMIKGEYRKDMGNQEFLDRLDEYNLTFFLDGDDKWYTGAGVHINSWVVVPGQDVEF